MEVSKHYLARADQEKALNEAGGLRGYFVGEGVDQIEAGHLHFGKLARTWLNSSSAVV
jgi:hypothetical protein